MKHMILTLLVLTASSTAFAGRVSKNMKHDACYFAQEVIPTADGEPMAIEECVRTFTFEALEKEDGQLLIGMDGQTLEDLQTACQVWIPIGELKNPPNDPPVCELN